MSCIAAYLSTGAIVSGVVCARTFPRLEHWSNWVTVGLVWCAGALAWAPLALLWALCERWERAAERRRERVIREWTRRMRR